MGTKLVLKGEEFGQSADNLGAGENMGGPREGPACLRRGLRAMV